MTSCSLGMLLVTTAHALTHHLAQTPLEENELRILPQLYVHMSRWVYMGWLHVHALECHLRRSDIKDMHLRIIANVRTR